MITKVTNTSGFCVQNYNFSTNKFSNAVKSNSLGLAKDTVSFSGKVPQEFIDKTVNLAFKKLNGFGKFSGTTKNNVNVNLIETSHSEDVILALTNIKFENRRFALFQLTKYPAPSRIVLLDKKNTVNDKKTVSLISKILKDSKLN